jgi:hypothetical protein
VEQRRLRLGDILDDYCPRERRVTNHAIVAMIEDDIKQTRCTTCDAEHAYKGAKVPRRRQKDAPTLVAPSVGAPPGNMDAGDVGPSDVALVTDESAAFEPEVEPATMTDEPLAAADAEERPATVIDDGPVHRPLIRAQLPRPEGQKTERPLPDFTMRHANGRGGNHAFRGNGRPKMRAHGSGGNGNRAHGRFQGQGRGGPHAGGGFRSGPPRHGGRKRSR